MASVISVVPLFPIIGLVRSRASSGFRPFSGKAVCSELSEQVACLEDILLKALEIEKAAETDL